MTMAVMVMVVMVMVMVMMPSHKSESVNYLSTRQHRW